MDNQPIQPPPPVPNVPISPPADPVVSPPPEAGPIKKLLSKKIILVILGVVVLAELLWAVSSLLKPKPIPVASESTAATLTKITSATLAASQTNIKVGHKLTVKIELSSDVKSDGVDMIILYDPKLLMVETLPDGTPVKVGNIFSSYPQNKLDSVSSRIVLSGIADQPGGVLASGSLGEVTFVAKAAGKAIVSLDFTPGSAADSNIVESGTGRDILGKVAGAEVIIQ